MKHTTVNLTIKQVKFLKDFKQQDKRSLREINRANILLLLDKGKQATEIVEFLDVGRRTTLRSTYKVCFQTGSPAHRFDLQQCTIGENKMDTGIIERKIKKSKRI